MIDHNDEQLGRTLASLLSQKPRKERAGCPDEEALSSYLAAGLTPTMAEEIEIHLAECTACLEELSAAYSSMGGEEKEAVPEALVTIVLQSLKLMRPWDRYA